jgi:hypothetical protein
MRLDKLKRLTALFDLGNKIKSKRIPGDRVHAIVMEEIAAEDWHKQLLVIVARVKAFFGYSKDKQDTLITAAELAELTEAPLGGDAEETTEDIDEAELDEARDLIEAKDLDGDDPAEFLAEQDEEREDSKQINPSR